MKKSYRNDLYLQWIREKKCLVSGKQADVAHHVRLNDDTSGTGLRPSDYRVIPLTNFFHTISPSSVHRLGEESFYRNYAIGPHRQIIAFLQEYLRITYQLEVYLPNTPNLMGLISFLEQLVEERRDRSREEKKTKRYNVILNKQRRQQYQRLKDLTEQRSTVWKELAKKYRQEKQAELKESAVNQSYRQELKERAGQFRREKYRKLKELRSKFFSNEKEIDC